MSASFFMIFLLALGGGGGDLLDYMPSDYYWQQNGARAVNTPGMTAVLDSPDADATDRLMAIRALGELGEEASLPRLEALVDSNEPFVGMYARRSIAWIKKQEPPMLAGVPAELLAKDVALLPPSATMAGQFRVPGNATPVSWDKIIPDLPGNRGMDKQEMLQDIYRGLYEMIGMLGNIRMDAVTFSISWDNNDNGPIVLIARGQYDRFRMIDVFAEEGFKGYSINDTEVLAHSEGQRESVAMVMPSDDLFILCVSEGGPLPVDELVDLIENDDAELAMSPVMRGQYEKIDTAKVQGWFITSVPQIFKQDPEMAEIFGPFDAGRITATTNDQGEIVIELVGEGDDADAIAAAVDTVNSHLAEGRAELNEELQDDPAMQPIFAPMLKIMNSIQIEAQGTTATGRMVLPADVGSMMPMWFMGM